MSRDSEEKVITETAELIAKRKKDLTISNTYLEAQLNSKQRMVDELKGEIAFLESKRNSLAETIKKEQTQLLNSIEERRKDTEKKYWDAKEAHEGALREKNMLEQEKSNVIGKRKELEGLIDSYTEKKNAILRLVETIK